MQSDSPRWIDIQDNYSYPLSQFVIPHHYQDDLESVLIPYGLIQDRVAKLAEMIAADTEHPLVACCVLKGAHVFFSHLTEQLKKLKTGNGNSIPMSFEFIKVKSYENENSTGHVSISLTEEELKSFKGKDILIVEDIVDTGNTMVALLGKLAEYQPASVKVVSLLLKRPVEERIHISLTLSALPFQILLSLDMRWTTTNTLETWITSVSSMTLGNESMQSERIFRCIYSETVHH